MACRGVLFSIDEATALALRTAASDEDRLDLVQEDIEEDCLGNHPEWAAETDKSWDFLHRALTDGQLGWDNGSFPLNHVVLGGEQLYSGDDYVMSLKSPDQVAAVAEALRAISEDELRRGFRQIPAADLEHSYEEDFEYTWSWFDGLRAFWERAAKERRYVLFTVDQ